MKKLSYILSLTLLVSFALVNTACEDEDANPYLDPLPGVHAFADFDEASSQSFIFGEPSTDVTINIQWVSIDRVLEVEKIDLYLLFNENFNDVDGNPRVARHGGAEGILFQTIEGSELPANRTNTSFTITQQQVYDLYQGVTYDYDGDGEAVDVFNNSFKPTRSATDRFIAGDDFSVRWELTTTDGQLFDSWSPSVCTEFPGANCEVAWSVVCVSDLAGDYTFVTTNMKEAGAGVAGTVSGEGSWTEIANAKYELTDYSFGLFGFVYEDDPAVGSLGITDACDDITVTGADQYGDTYTYSFSGFDGPTMTITWVNTYGDGGTTVITRTDGADWPTTLF
ncbi:MAG: hypothetical protein RIG62_11495 [Cyclobacteriaceae bacterium]